MVESHLRTGERAALEALRDAAQELMRFEPDPDLPDSAVAPVRERVLALYRSYVARFGALNRGELREGRVDPATGRPALRWHRPTLDGFRRDPGYHLVMALEAYDQASGESGPAPILLRRVHGRQVEPGAVATPFEALAVCRADGGVDLVRIARLLDLSGAAAAEQALGDLIFRDPVQGGGWVTASDYLAGDVRSALAAAREAAERDASYDRNVAALQAAVPPDLGPLEIDVSLGSPVVEPGDVEAFVHEVLGGRVRVWHLPSAAWWKIVPTGRVPATGYGTARLGAYEILAAGLNGRLPMVIDSLPGPVPGRRVRRRNAVESLAAQDRLSALQERFRTWVWEDASRAERLCREYNRRFNSHVPPPDHGALLTFPGLADGIELWPWQREIIARIVSAPATLCAHAVGAGKTRSMVGAAITARRLGLARKPLIAVPAHLVEQVAREARQAYPFGRFLVQGAALAEGTAPLEGEAPGSAGGRHRLAARCATGDWDAVIVSHGLLGSVPVAPDTERADLSTRISRTRSEIDAGTGGRHGRALLRRRLTALQAREQELATSPAPAVTFDSLGVDLLLVDEAHYFKRLPITTRRVGISLGSSRRAADLELKARTLRARRGDLPSLALFTGTPWSNTVAETFVWQTFVQPDVLRAAGLEHFDAWASVFVEYESIVEVAPDSAGIRVTQRPSKVRNLPELVRSLNRSAVVLPPAALDLERPARRDETVVCEAGPQQRAYLGGLAARADKLRRERVRGAPGEDNMLALCGDGRRVALDPRLVGIDEASSKVIAVADRVSRNHRDGADFQIVFCDQGTPGADGPQTYGRLRIALVERGVPAERVRWVHDARTPAARAELYADCRAGRVAVLIGSTDTVGTGANVQTRLRAIHHLDAPWRPSDVEQREGRALRPGNRNAEVEIIRYVTRGTFDGYMWQTLERKARFIEDLRRGDVPDRVVDDLGDTVLTYAEVKALATGNELLLEHARASADVARLRVLRSVSRQGLTAARAELAAGEQERYRCGQRERMLLSAAARLAEGLGDDAAVPVGIEALRVRLRTPDDTASSAPIRAPWRGLGIELVPRGGWRAPKPREVIVRVTLAHRRVDEIALPTSAVLRGTSGIGHALQRWVSDLPAMTAAAGRDAADADTAAERAAGLIAGHRFEQQDALRDAEARLALITVALEASVDAVADPDAA